MFVGRCGIFEVLAGRQEISELKKKGGPRLSKSICEGKTEW